MKITVKLKPGAKMNKIARKDDGTYEAWVTARPHGGKANDALIGLLADHFGLAKSRVVLVKGLASRIKTVEVAGL